MNVIQAFKILELPPTATQIDVKASFRRLAKKWHPDVNSADTTKKFQQINEAYEIAYKHAVKNKKPKSTPPAKSKPSKPVKKNTHKRSTTYTRDNNSATKTTKKSSNLGAWIIIACVCLFLLILIVPGLQLILLIVILYTVTRIL